MEKKQAELQDRYHRALEAEENEMNCPKREVTPMWRLCIADSMEQPGRGVSSFVFLFDSFFFFIITVTCELRCANFFLF